jgi:hypothetical protein
MGAIILYIIGVLVALPFTITYEYKDLKSEGNVYFTFGDLMCGIAYSLASWLVAIPLLYNFFSRIKLFKIQRNKFKTYEDIENGHSIFE